MSLLLPLILIALFADLFIGINVSVAMEAARRLLRAVDERGRRRSPSRTHRGEAAVVLERPLEMVSTMVLLG